MRTCIFDLETFTLQADTGILLCACLKEYRSDKPPVMIRADEFPNWKRNRSNCGPVCKAILKEMADYDIFVAHNGVWFDRAMLVSLALRYNLPLFLRFSKFIDPLQLARKHLRLSRNSLAYVLDFLDIEQDKTAIKWDEWKRAAYDGSSQSMDYICEHCLVDVQVLERAYDRMRKLVRDVRDNGSAF